MAYPRIGILLCERASDRQVGLIEFYRDGVLGFNILQPGLHVFALKPVERILWTTYKEPLYRNYATRIRRKGRIGARALKQEAQAGAAAHNRARPMLKVGSTPVRARVVQY